MSEVKFEIVKKIKVLSNGAKKSKELNVVKWGNMEPMFDVRKWEDGQPGKGITLTKDEAKELCLALTAELEQEK